MRDSQEDFYEDAVSGIEFLQRALQLEQGALSSKVRQEISTSARAVVTLDKPFVLAGQHSTQSANSL